tara:strand:+ start:103 stop:381 length:279 start_codon:yes stop_codon:yes gene_type:complete
VVGEGVNVTRVIQDKDIFYEEAFPAVGERRIGGFEVHHFLLQPVEVDWPGCNQQESAAKEVLPGVEFHQIVVQAAQANIRIDGGSVLQQKVY